MVNETLILNTSLYTVKFTDITEAEYSANIIAENMWEQCDNVVNQVQLTEDVFKTQVIQNIIRYIPVGKPIFYMF